MTKILEQFYDAWGELTTVSSENIARLKSAGGSIKCTDKKSYVVVERTNGKIQFHLPLLKESDDLVILDERGQAVAFSQGADGVTVSQGLAVGYYFAKSESSGNSTIIFVRPKTCYVESGRDKFWGLSVQLHSLKSETNWGIGDLTDLKNLAVAAAKKGFDYVGLNPIHALFWQNSSMVSPYAPSNRELINFLYIDLEALPEFAWLRTNKIKGYGDDLDRELAALRRSEYISYHQIHALKKRALIDAFNQLSKGPGDELAKRYAEFESWRSKLDVRSPMLKHAVYEVKQQLAMQMDETCWGWPVWADAISNIPDSQVVADYGELTGFHLYVQWVAHAQLAKAQQAALNAGMHVGIYRDLAVGFDRAGSECFSFQEEYTLEANVGAPPDVLCPPGQDWGLPALKPDALISSDFEAFITLVRSNMQSAGALRIDHVMSLYRLWWVPHPGSAKDGAYIVYPMEALFAIVCIESQRNRCTVIGEALGTVPQEISTAMERDAILHYQIIYFSKNGGQFFESSRYPQTALSSVGTHDLPTFKGFLSARDIHLKYQARQLESEAQYQSLLNERAQEVEAFKSRLLAEGCLDSARENNDDTLTSAAYRFLNKTPCRFSMVAAEDLLGEKEQPNLPGTIDEHPNWKRKLKPTVEQMFQGTLAKSILSAIGLS